MSSYLEVAACIKNVLGAIQDWDEYERDEVDSDYLAWKEERDERRLANELGILDNGQDDYVERSNLDWEEACGYWESVLSSDRFRLWEDIEGYNIAPLDSIKEAYKTAYINEVVPDLAESLATAEMAMNKYVKEFVETDCRDSGETHEDVWRSVSYMWECELPEYVFNFLLDNDFFWNKSRESLEAAYEETGASLYDEKL